MENSTLDFRNIAQGNSLSGMSRDLTSGHASSVLLAVSILVVVALFTSRLWGSKQPPRISDPLPFIFNTAQFVYANERFMNRVKHVLKTTNVAKFYMGVKPVYLLAGSKNIQAIFGRSQNINNYEIMLRWNLPKWYRLSKNDIKRFAADKSGRGRNPLPGTEGIAPDHRFFYGYEHVHTEYLGKPQYLNPLVEYFMQDFCRTLDGYANSKCTTLSVREFCKHDVTRCAVRTLLGPKPNEIYPNFENLMWDFDEEAFHIALGLPRWIYPHPHKVHERYLAATQEYLDAAWAAFDWDDPSATAAAWEPHFGARVCREILKWFKDSGFHEPATGAGAMAILLWAANSNVIPLSLWMLFEVAKDASLLQSLRDEVNTAYVTDPSTGSRDLNLQKFAALPLLTSVYTETLRLSMSFNVVRNVSQTFTLDGYKIPKGSLAQAPTLVAHYDENVWGAEGHAASEFWAERHIRYTDEKDDAGNPCRKRVFDMGGRSGSYFPYGGGNLICPGRNLAKLEMTLTVALLIVRYDVEFVEWTMFDGSPSDRPPQHLGELCGGGTAQPDRDMKIRIRPIASF